jgi:hypothetical protein
MFNTLSEQTEWYKYYYADGECAKKYNLTTGISVFRLFDESPIQYTGKFKKNIMVEWMKNEGLESSGPLSDDILQAAFAEGYELMVLFHDKGEEQPYFKEF